MAQVILCMGQVQANNSGLMYVWVSFGSPNPLSPRCQGKSECFLACGVFVQGQQVVPVVVTVLEVQVRMLL